MWTLAISAASFAVLVAGARWFERHQRRPGGPPFFVRVSLFALLLEAPFAWLLWIDYPTSSYKTFWLIHWPALPGFPAILVARRFGASESVQWLSMALLAATLFVTLVVVSRLSRWWFGTLVVLTVAYGIALGFATHGAFRM